MLSEEMTHLLTAYVDGELSQRQRKAVLRLLHQSSEARELLLQLQENAHKIKKLPRRSLGAGFAHDVLDAIAKRNVQPEPIRRPVAARLRWLPYVAAGMAAAVLFVAVLSGAVYIAIGGFLPDGGNNLVKVDPDAPPVNPVNGGVKPPIEIEVTPPPRKVPNPLIARLTEGIYQSYAAPIPPERHFSVAFQDLNKKDSQAAAKLAAELKKERLELDVVVRSNSQALDRLKSVLKEHGIRLEVDPGNKAMLDKGQAKTELLIYAEGVQPDELAKILKQLATDDKKNPTPFDKVSVAALSPQAKQQVASLFGTDPEKRNFGTTVGILKDKKDKDKIKDKVNPKPPVGKVERVAVVLPPSPMPTNSEEVRHFLYQPADPAPGSIRVLLRIRQE